MAASRVEADVRAFARLFHEALERDSWGDIDPFLLKMIAEGIDEEDDNAKDAKALRKVLMSAMKRSRHENARMQRYVCAHCEARPPRGDYMVHAEVWAKAKMPQRGFLCLVCLEKRLIAAGHGPLQLNDFTRAPCNAGIVFGYAMAKRVTNATRKRGVDARSTTASIRRK